MKRFSACLVSVVLAFGLLPASAFGVGLHIAETDGSEAGSSAWKPAATTAHEYATLDDGFSMSRVGIGGHGAVFHPVISPFDHDTIIASCDMGGFYVTHDAGSNWQAFSLNGRIWATAADPGTEGTFYAGGSGLWRSTDNGDSWQMIWPKSEAIQQVQSKLNHNRTYYYTSDSYPDQSAVEAICVDPGDSNHIVVLCAPAVGYADGMRSLCESFDGGVSFQVSVEFKVEKKPKDATFENVRVFVEAGATARESRVVAAVPDGIFELNRNALAGSGENGSYIYKAPATIQDAAQVVKDGTAHYVVLENLTDEAAAPMLTRVKLWHTANFADANATIDLTDELIASLPRTYSLNRDRSGEPYRIEKHNAVTLCAPSLDRMYLGYRCQNADTTNPGSDSWQGVTGLVTYDSSRAAGSRFEWAFGLRRFWSGDDVSKRVAPDANCLMARGHSDSSGYTMLGLAADPNDDKRVALGTHIGLFYSPDIDADVGVNGSRDPKVNLYPRYAVACEDDTTNGGRAANLHEYRMRSTGLEVTMAYHVRTDPHNENHVMICLDDAGCAHSFDGGETWSRFYTKLPDIHDTLFDAVFDEGIEGVVYGGWDAKGSSAYSPSAQWYQYKSAFARSEDGGMSWSQSYSSGLPDNASVVSIAVDYPRDAYGNVTGGERTIYVATMGFGFYVSHDSGRTFEPMNTGIPTVACTVGGVEYQSVWARDIMVTADGRVFGMTQYSSLGPKNANDSATYHSTQDERTFGNVWEWDANANDGAGAWVRLPLNYAGANKDGSVNVRQPRAFAYDEGTGVLYVAAVSVMGPGTTNFGGGLYAYESDSAVAVGEGTARRLDAPSSPDVCGDSLTAVGFDSYGRTWVSTEDGDVYYHEGKGAAPASGWRPVFKNALRLCSGFDFDADGDVYLTSHGVSSLRFHPKAVPDKPSPQPPAPEQESAAEQAEGMRMQVTPVVALSKSRMLYSGKPRKPSVTVWADPGKKARLSSQDYRVTYADNKNVGKATVKVDLVGKYSGSKTVAFSIVPRATSLAKLKAAKRGFTAKWKKQARQTSGYQVQYGLKASFKGAKTITVKGAKKTSAKASKLKAKKKYYVRVRTFKTVKGTKYCSDWSKAKSVKTR